MVSVRWLRIPRTGPASSAQGGRPTTADLDAWLETVHRLAHGRVTERRRLAATGEATRARLRGGG